MILKCCSQINGDRTIQAIYHLFTGKRSIQTVQDAHLYQLTNIYGIYKTLSLKNFQENIHQLHKQNYITRFDHENVYTITSKGLHWLEDHEKSLSFSTFNGLTYHSIDLTFFSRLVLLIQVLTNRRNNCSSYIPIIDQQSITNWVKEVYPKFNVDVNYYLNVIYVELHHLLSDFPEQEADLFVNRLTGYKKFGMSIQQLAQLYQITDNDIQMLFIKVIHQMIDTINNNNDRYKFMSFLLNDLSITGFITDSAYKTYQLINKGYSINQIAHMRALKKNTIYDHVVEIALYDQQFPINTYLSEQEQVEIIQAARHTNSSKLSTIKRHVNENISYFQIRLALAVMTTR